MDKCITWGIFARKCVVFCRIVLKKAGWGVEMLFVLNSRKLFVVLALLCALQLTLTVYLYFSSSGNVTSLLDYTVVIDAGHGGVDAGVTGVNGTKESHLNLVYSKQLGQLFSQCGFNVVYTRTDENGLYGLPTQGFKMRDMNKRMEIINESEADIVISVHMNKYSSDYRTGAQVFFQKGSEAGQLLANSIQQYVNRLNSRNLESIAGDYFITRESNCVGVIVECGFLSNASEEEKLNTPQHQQQLTNAIFCGVMMYLYSL